MSAGYTPGPWLCQSPEEDGSIYIIGDNLGGLVGAAHCWPTEIDAGGSDRVRANARLIAAAPELVAALRGLLDEVWSSWHSHMDRNAFEAHFANEFKILARVKGE